MSLLAEAIILANASFTAAKSALVVTKLGSFNALSKALSCAATAALMSLGSMVKPDSNNASTALATPLGFRADSVAK